MLFNGVCGINRSMLNKKETSSRNQIRIVSIEDLVPQDHILQKIEKAIDFGFMYEEVKDLQSGHRQTEYRPGMSSKAVHHKLLVRIPISFSGDIRGKNGFVFVENVPGSGLKSVLPSCECHVSVSPWRLENKFFTITFDRSYQMISVYDKLRQRELVPEGKACNRLVAFEDRPGHFDAWELKEYYKEKGYPVDDVSGLFGGGKQAGDPRPEALFRFGDRAEYLALRTQ